MSRFTFEESTRNMFSANNGEEGSGEGDAIMDDVFDNFSEGTGADTGSLFELLSRMKDSIYDDDSNSDADSIDMDANDYHNKAVDHSRHGKHKLAAETCMEGLKYFPLNVDLLADTIMYSSKSGNMDNAAKHYEILKDAIPVQRWNWRAFTFSFDFLLENDPVANEDECRAIIENYKKFIPYEEKAYMAESELEMALGNAERSMAVLKEAIASRENASQCALRLADMQLDRGLYEEVIATANYGIAASAEVQPSINIPYLYYIRALAKDNILHKKECRNESVEKKDVEALSAEYELLLSKFPELMNHASTITMRKNMLDFMKIA